MCFGVVCVVLEWGAVYWRGVGGTNIPLLLHAQQPGGAGGPCGSDIAPAAAGSAAATAGICVCVWGGGGGCAHSTPFPGPWSGSPSPQDPHHPLTTHVMMPCGVVGLGCCSYSIACCPPPLASSP